jgi:hypothetical protein
MFVRMKPEYILARNVIDDVRENDWPLRRPCRIMYELLYYTNEVYDCTKCIICTETFQERGSLPRGTDQTLSKAKQWLSGFLRRVSCLPSR